MKPFDINLNDYSVCVLDNENQAQDAYVCDRKDVLIVVTQPEQSIVLQAADEVPLFVGIKGQFLTGKAYSVDDAIRERPLIDFKNLIEQLHYCPEDIQVFLGPSLSFSHIEEKEETLARVNELGYGLACKGTSGKLYLDHQLLVCLQMRKLGIPMANIHQSVYDTFDTKGLKSNLGGDMEKNRFLAVLH